MAARLALVIFCFSAYLFGASNWGPHVEGVVSRLNTNEKVLYLTFDACGGGRGSGYDSALVNFLTENQIEATLFINSRWIDANPETFKKLSQNPLFSLQNHGTRHKPLSVTQRRIYGIRATGSEEATRYEIVANHNKMLALTGKSPKFFRAGTAFYDTNSVKLAGELGYRIIGFDINGDGGATFSAKTILHECKKARNGSIVIFHMNRPKRHTLEGFKQAYQYWKEQGFQFRKLERDLKKLK